MRRAAFFVIAGPACIVGYGLVRLWGKSDGTYGPGFDWQAAEMSALGADFKDVPGVEVAFYDVVPQLFFLGLVVLVGMLAAHRRLPWWGVAVLLVGIVLPAVTLDLLPLGGLCMLVALAPALPALRRSALRASVETVI